MSKKKKLVYFFLNGDLHMTVQINRGKDRIHAWNFPKRELKAYSYSDTLRKHQRAFRTREVAQMLNRKPKQIREIIVRGMIEPPQFTYAIENPNGELFQYMWTEKDIMNAHEYYSTVHYGRPRKDGLITPLNLPTARELRAMIHDEEVLYVKQGDKFVPTWRAKDF